MGISKNILPFSPIAWILILAAAFFVNALRELVDFAKD